MASASLSVALTVPDAASLKRLERTVRAAAQAARELEAGRLGDVLGRYEMVGSPDMEELTEFLEAALSEAGNAEVTVLVIARVAGREESGDGRAEGEAAY